MSIQSAGSTAAPDAARDPRAKRVGVVSSAGKRDKTVRVTVQYVVQNQKYGKYLRRNTSFQVHDERNEAAAGDTVEIAECRPISRTKTWRLVRILNRAPREAGGAR